MKNSRAHRLLHLCRFRARNDDVEPLNQFCKEKDGAKLLARYSINTAVSLQRDDIAGYRACCVSMLFMRQIKKLSCHKIVTFVTVRFECSLFNMNSKVKGWMAHIYSNNIII